MPKMKTATKKTILRLPRQHFGAAGFFLWGNATIAVVRAALPSSHGVEQLADSIPMEAALTRDTPVFCPLCFHGWIFEAFAALASSIAPRRKIAHHAPCVIPFD